MIADQFEKARFGYFDNDLVFHEVNLNEATIDHPFISRMRWVGGPHDHLLALAVEKAVLDRQSETKSPAG
jgi:hypothetical protein